MTVPTRDHCMRAAIGCVPRGGWVKWRAAARRRSARAARAA
ncbi:hypothetical protein [Streptomyces sp.]|nr:hypothetical protein [Streptomyces sp.]HET6359635.1 hypothetical protein [Streptomyces sp.]